MMPSGALLEVEIFHRSEAASSFATTSTPYSPILLLAFPQTLPLAASLSPSLYLCLSLSHFPSLSPLLFPSSSSPSSSLPLFFFLLVDGHLLY